MKKHSQGLTLIELMIVVAIIAILAAVGYPAYQNYVLKAHRVDAEAALMEIAEIMERNFAISGRYNVDASGNAVAAVPALNRPNLANYYTIAFAAGEPTATTYQINATRTGTNTDKCGNLTINQTGTKTAAAQAGCAW